MKLSVEISMYPLSEAYMAPIQAFIERLHDYSDLEVVTNAMSTQIFGDYARVFEVLQREMWNAHQTDGQAVFVTKFLAGDVRPVSGH